MSTLPPFPVDDATLDLLWAAMYPRENGDPDAKSSGVWPLLTFMSQMGGSDTDAVEDESDDGSMRTMRDPHYHDHDVISSLITEVRRLRTAGERAAGWREAIEALRLRAIDIAAYDDAYMHAADFLESLAPKETP